MRKSIGIPSSMHNISFAVLFGIMVACLALGLGLLGTIIWAIYRVVIALT